MSRKGEDFEITGLSSRRKLGVIVPADRPDREWNIVGLGESGDYGHWLEAHGVDWIEVLFGESETDGSHALDSVWETGRLENLIPPARRLAAAGCDGLVWACTCASFIGGLAWSREQAAALSRDTGLPTTSTSLALLAALESLGADTVDLLSPYPPPVTAALEDFLGQAGIRVAATVILDCPDDSTSIKLDLRREAQDFAGGLPRRGHPLLVPDTAVYSLDVVATIEADLGRPVVAANQATLWHGLRLLEVSQTISGVGALFGDSGQVSAEQDVTDGRRV